MAVLTAEQFAEIRKQVSGEETTITYVKNDVNDAIQAIEDWWEANQASLSSAIDTATSVSFTNTQKKRIAKFWLRQRFQRGN